MRTCDMMSPTRGRAKINFPQNRHKLHHRDFFPKFAIYDPTARSFFHIMAHILSIKHYVMIAYDQFCCGSMTTRAGMARAARADNAGTRRRRGKQSSPWENTEISAKGSGRKYMTFHGAFLSNVDAYCDQSYCWSSRLTLCPRYFLLCR
jgi:hypothetical protein